MRKVSVIVTHHLNENDHYLKAALDSLENQTRRPDAIHVIKTQEHPELDNSTKKVHYAVDNLIPADHDIMMMSDDVVIGRNTIMALMNGADWADCIQNPLSNNESGSRWFGPNQLPPSMEYRKDMIKAAMETDGDPVYLFPVQWISFYCTYIPREVWNKVGRLDEVLDPRGNDVDYCMRAAQLGIPTFINTGGFAIHFGSKTLPKVTKAEDYAAADSHFAKKWAVNNQGQNLQST